MKNIEGDFEAALYQLIQSLSHVSWPSNGASREEQLLAQKLLREWDNTRGNDWFTQTLKRRLSENAN